MVPVELARPPGRPPPCAPGGGARGDAAGPEVGREACTGREEEVNPTGLLYQSLFPEQSKKKMCKVNGVWCVV